MEQEQYQINIGRLGNADDPVEYEISMGENYSRITDPKIYLSFYEKVCKLNQLKGMSIRASCHALGKDVRSFNRFSAVAHLNITEPDVYKQIMQEHYINQGMKFSEFAELCKRKVDPIKLRSAKQNGDVL